MSIYGSTVSHGGNSTAKGSFLDGNKETLKEFHVNKLYDVQEFCFFLSLNFFPCRVGIWLPVSDITHNAIW